VAMGRRLACSWGVREGAVIDVVRRVIAQPRAFRINGGVS
jgi:hypothetical protein